MRAFAHLLSILLIAPQALLFATVKVLHHVTATRTFFGFLSDSLDTIDALLGWVGLEALAVLIVLVIAGFRAKWRPWASVCVLAANVYTAIHVVTWMAASPLGDKLFVLSPAIVSALLCVYVIRRDFAPSRVGRPRPAADGASSEYL